MPARNVRVDIKQRDHLEMIRLVTAILKRHTDLGGTSPLEDPVVDMATLETQHDLHEEKYTETREQDGFSQAATEEADIALGINEGQDSDSEGTIYFHMTQVIARLEQFYRDKEEQISTFSFNVVKDVVRGRVTVRVELPIRKPLEMIRLVAAVLKRHNALGGTSPLDTPEVDMAGLQTLHDLHKAKREEAKEFDGKSQSLMEEARIALGIDKGQTIRTKGTVYNITGEVRDKLLGVHRNHEEELSTYGFNVVITMTPLPGEDEPTVIEGAVAAGSTEGIFDELADDTSLTIENTGTVALTFCRMEDGISACDPVAHITVNPGETTPATGTDLGASGTWLNISNFDSSDVGTFRVTIE